MLSITREIHTMHCQVTYDLLCTNNWAEPTRWVLRSVHWVGRSAEFGCTWPIHILMHPWNSITIVCVCVSCCMVPFGSWDSIPSLMSRSRFICNDTYECERMIAALSMAGLLFLSNVYLPALRLTLLTRYTISMCNKECYKRSFQKQILSRIFVQTVAGYTTTIYLINSYNISFSWFYQNNNFFYCIEKKVHIKKTKRIAWYVWFSLLTKLYRSLLAPHKMM